MLVERHIFGSIRGYGTLAQSPGLTPAECRLLENFNFGQPQDAEYLASLAKTPAYWIRPLGPRRRVLTRVVRGMADDQGRSTVLLISAVLSAADWDGMLRGDVSVLLRKEGLWQWDGAPQLQPLDVSTSPPSHVAIGRGSVEKLLSLITLIEHNHTRHRSVVVREADLTPDEMRGIEMLVPPSARAGFSSAYRSLNSRLVASLNCVADGVVIDQAAEVFVPGRPLPRSFYAGVLHDAGLTTGRVDTGFIAAYDGFGKFASPEAGVRGGPPGSQPVIVVPAACGGSRVALLAGWLLSAVLLIALCLTWNPERPVVDSGNTAVETPAAVTFSEAQWRVFVNASKELLSPSLLHRDRSNRDAVVDGYKRLVESIPADSGEKVELRQSLDAYNAAADALNLFDDWLAKADADLSTPSLTDAELEGRADVVERVYARDCDRMTQAVKLAKELAKEIPEPNGNAPVISPARLSELQAKLNRLACLVPEANHTLVKLRDQLTQHADAREKQAEAVRDELGQLAQAIGEWCKNNAGSPVLRQHADQLADRARRFAADDRMGQISKRMIALVRQIADFADAQATAERWRKSHETKFWEAVANLHAVGQRLEAYSGDDARSAAEEEELGGILRDFKEALAVLTPAASQPGTP